ncbi:hypothetical protein PCASD_07963 [Puccinia coronata f. sp. avenae]|uniref:Uncharacterized protein n=1 Tax=Puccinia coronata f. sp. avenae TaxID=200324 RepID=A0A2N5UTS8_9BASI|nr:hypothetical protein PCASD_07963 [Puccinia coronata f. sp. avenae]
MPPPAQPPNQQPSTAPNVSAQPLPSPNVSAQPLPYPNVPAITMSAGTKANFYAITKAKRAKKPLPSPYSREPSKKTPAAAPDTPLPGTLVNCGILILKDDKFLKKLTESMKAKIEVDISQPNLYHNLQCQLWELFSAELIKKNLIHQLPDDPLQQRSLSHGTSRLPDLKTLITHLKDMKKKPEVNLIYEDVQTTFTSLETRTSLSTNVTQFPTA